MAKLIEHLNDHPDEWQLLLYHAKWWRPRMSTLSRIMGFLFQGEDSWRRESGNHMAWRQGADTFSAEWPALRPRPTVKEAAKTGQTIHVFGFNPPLSDEEQEKLQRWVLEQLNKPYDTWLCTNRALRALARLYGTVLPICDFSSDMAYICYEYLARGINLLGRATVNPATFGPPDLWALANARVLIYRGILQESI